MKAAAGKKIAVAVLASVLVLVAVLLLLLPQSKSYAVIYAKGRQSLFLAMPEGVFPLQGESKAQWFSPDKEYLFYDSLEESGTAIYVCALQKSASRKVGGKLVAQAARAQWTANGAFIVYIEEKGGRLQSYHLQRETTEQLAEYAENLYAEFGQDVFFFTKKEGETAALFRCIMGQQPERMASDVSDIHFFAEESGMQLFYTAEAALYAVGATGPTAQVAQAPAHVFFGEYRLGGTLYYLQRAQGAASATLQVDDPYQSVDAAQKEPNPKDYLQIPFLGKLLGDGGYSKAVAAYRQKQQRDKVRAAAAQAMEEMPAGVGGLNCFAYDGVRARLLARRVGFSKGQTELAMRATGRPALVYKKEQLEEPGEALHIGLDQLVLAFGRNGQQGVREELAALLAPEGAEALVYTLALSSKEVPSEVQLEQSFGLGGLQVLFAPGSEEMFVLGNDQTLYRYTLMNYGVSQRQVCDSGVTYMAALESDIYYLKNGDLFRCDPDGSVLVLRHVSVFFAGGENTIFAMANLHGDVGALYALPEGKQARLLATQAKLGSAKVSQGQCAWLARWTKGTGALYFSGASGKSKQLDSGVTEILLVR